MFDRLTALLGRAGVDLSTEELLDVLWIAEVRRRGEPGHEPPPGPVPDARPVRALEPEEQTRDYGSRRSGHDFPVPEPEPERVEPQGLYAPAATGSATGRSARAVGVTGVRSLESQRALNRAMRPLRRTVGSRTDLVLDEAATVERMAETSLPEPVLRPRPERWLSAVLVVDDGPSMVLWQRYAAEIRALLESQGAFHDLRVHGLDSSGGPGPLLHARPFAPGPRTQAALRTDPVRPTPVLVLSDMVGPAWHSGAVPALLRSWGRQAPVTIIQPLPERMWPAPGGHPAERLLVRSRHPAAPSRALRVTHPVLPPELVSYGGTPVPVLEAVEGRLAPWVSLLTEGDSRAALPVLMIPDTGPEPAARVPAESTAPPPPPSPSPEERFRRFREAASPEGRRLAGALASVTPLTLPVMRLVHEAHRTAGGTFHRAQLAEVFLGGLLRRSGRSATGDGAEYAFLPGVADLLLDTVRTSVALDTADRVGAYLLERSGAGPEFRARLSGDGSDATTSLPDHAGPFAAASPELLRRLGLADGAGTDPRPEPRPTDAPEPEPAPAEEQEADGPVGPAELFVMEEMAPALVAFARRVLEDPAVPGVVVREADPIVDLAESWQPGFGWNPVTHVASLGRRLVECRMAGLREELTLLIRELLTDLRTRTDLVTRTMWGNLAIALSGLGETAEATDELRAIIAIAAETHGPDHDYTLNARRFLQEMLYDDDCYAEAVEEGTGLLTAYRRLDAEEFRWEYTQVLKYQAYALHRLDRPQEAQELLSLVLARQSRQEDRTSLNLRLHTRSWYAATLSEQGHYAEAESELRAGLVELEGSEGDAEGAGVIRILDGLADLLDDFGRHEEAEPYRRATIEASQRYYGADRMTTFRAWRDLIATLRSLERFPEARDEVDALEPRVLEALGEYHRETLSVREIQALIRGDLHEYDDAVDRMHRVIEQTESLGPSERRAALGFRHDLGAVLHAAGRSEEAEQLLRVLLADMCEQLGPEHVFTGLGRYHLAHVLMSLDRDEEALALFQELLVIEERTLPEWSLSTAKTRQRMATVLTNLGRHEEAAGQLGLAWAAHVRAMGPDALPALSVGHRYGVALTAVGRHREAVDVLTTVVGGRRTRRGEAHPDTLRSRQRLGDALAAQGLADRARAEWTEVRDNASAELGEDHEIVRTANESLAALGAPPAPPLR
ncbi:SAV_2336 N-terminal domain-related protein [Streptomyces sp. NPDC091416]|uniref:SAV_2336 N-terminal domain-related protein n=1 Tax=Streptomyces sp. NPDC091416 TaxID=3366003 RepID=UPI0038062273